MIEGKILILGPEEIQQPGSLGREFVESLKKLQRWDKSEYYCSSDSLYDSLKGTKKAPGAPPFRHEGKQRKTGHRRIDVFRGICSGVGDRGRNHSQTLPASLH
jgi:hypothetical protein